MLIIKITDGLGNQMFQYATGKALAKSKKTEYALDISWFDSINTDFTKRIFSLGGFNTNYNIISDKDRNFFLKPSYPIIIRSFYYRRQNMLPYYKRRHIKEQCFEYDPNITKCPENSYIQGFWQSYKYFESIRSQLLEDFSLKKESEEFMCYKNKIDTSNSVSVHIRRGDYCNRSANPEHTLLSIGYYKKAIAHIKSKVVEDCTFFIFSDDINWVKENITFPDHYFIHDAQSDNEEIMLMKACKHNIIANSSFSWWGAWLNENKDKIVIAPKNWFSKTSNKSTKDLIPDEWIQL